MSNTLSKIIKIRTVNELGVETQSKGINSSGIKGTNRGIEVMDVTSASREGVSFEKNKIFSREITLIISLLIIGLSHSYLFRCREYLKKSYLTN